MKKANILIVDDHTIFRAGLKKIIQNFSFVRNVREAGSGEDALNQLTENKIDILLLDYELPDMTGAEVINQVRKNHDYVKILILTMHDESSLIANLLQLGINGFLLKDSEPAQLKEAIKTLLVKDAYFSDRVVEILRDIVIQYKSEEKDVPPLSPREIQVLNLIIKDFSNDEIAEELAISRRTVEKVRANVMKKVGARNIIGLIKYAIKSDQLK